LEALEMLAIGIQGKLALWRALQVAGNSRLTGVDYDRLSARARAQFDEVENRRLEAAQVVLADRRPSSVGKRSPASSR
jgi:hypothetical protein